MPNPVSAILSEINDPVALFCDFDGTLVEIAPSPDTVLVPTRLIPQLMALKTALDGALAIITGRPIADIDDYLPDVKVSIFGSHGAERRHAGKTSSPSEELADQATQIAESVEQALGDDTNILIETKPAGVAVHYRSAPDRGADVRSALDSAIADFDDFHAISGKKVVEARIRGTDKGKAVAQLMSQLPFSGRMPIFIGDDVTDEDGYRAAAALGGFGIKVGAGDTAARFRLDTVDQVHALLDALAARHGAPVNQQIENPSSGAIT